MELNEIKPGDLVLWSGPKWKFNPLLRRVTEIRGEEVYFEKGLPTGKGTCSPAELSHVPTDYKYSKYPIQRQ